MSKRFARQRPIKMAWTFNYVFVQKKNAVKRRRFAKQKQMKMEMKKKSVNVSKRNVNKEKSKFALSRNKKMMK